MSGPWGLDARHRWDEGVDVLMVPFRRVYTCGACGKSRTVSTDRVVPDSVIDALVGHSFRANPYRQLFGVRAAV